MLSDERIKEIEAMLKINATYECGGCKEVIDLLAERKELIDRLRWRSMQSEPPEPKDSPIVVDNKDDVARVYFHDVDAWIDEDDNAYESMAGDIWLPITCRKRRHYERANHPQGATENQEVRAP